VARVGGKNAACASSSSIVLAVEITAINPFDFFIDRARKVPFV